MNTHSTFADSFAFLHAAARAAVLTAGEAPTSALLTLLSHGTRELTSVELVAITAREVMEKLRRPGAVLLGELEGAWARAGGGEAGQVRGLVLQLVLDFGPVLGSVTVEHALPGRVGVGLYAQLVQATVSVPL